MHALVESPKEQSQWTKQSSNKSINTNVHVVPAKLKVTVREFLVEVVLVIAQMYS